MTSALWYLGRGTGITALLLLTASVGLGISSRARRPLFGLPRFALAWLHRNAALLTMLLLTIHIGTLLADPYAQLKLVDLVVPFSSTYRPLWVGMGALSLDVLVAVVVTSLLRERIGHRVWRAVHWMAYGIWPFALLHSIGSGTDNRTPWLRLVAVACTVFVAGAVAWRSRFPTIDAELPVRRPAKELAR